MLFPDSELRSPGVEAWLASDRGALGAIADRWFNFMRSRGEDVRELLHDGHPTACIGEAAFAYVNTFQKHVNVGFFLGTELEDPSGLLVGTGKFMRHVKVIPGLETDELAIEALIQQAYEGMRQLLVEKQRTIKGDI